MDTAVHGLAAIVMTPAELREALREARLLAIVRGPDPAGLIVCLRTLADAGVRLAEVSLTSTSALEVLKQATSELGDRLTIGAGTVLTAEDAHRSHSAGAEFLVTPAGGKGEDAGQEIDMAVLTGALTPTEVWAAYQRGAAAVKLFPASLGGTAYVRALRDPFPQVPLVPVGGVDLEAASAYMEAGALAIGVGSPLLGDAVTGGRRSDLAGRAQRFLEAVR